MSISTWDEIRTAYHVARMGTVSGAAEALGVHHATVIRHIDSLESRLGVKLFQRHARGYTATEAGKDLLQVAQATDDQFSQLVSRIRGRGDEVSGELVVRYLTGDEVLRLEYGEAHVAVRAGRAPDNPDNVVQPFVTQHVALYASRDYIEAKGRPDSIDDLGSHEFVSQDNLASRAPFTRWLMERASPGQVKFRATDDRVIRDAILSGVGCGFITVWEAERFPDLVQLFEPQEAWSAPLWLVTHVDLHRTTKVQAFLTFLKNAAKSW